MTSKISWFGSNQTYMRHHGENPKFRTPVDQNALDILNKTVQTKKQIGETKENL